MSLHDVPPISRIGHREQDVENKNAGVLELVDEVDSKSIASDGVRVRVPPPAPPPRGPKVLELQAFRAFLITRPGPHNLEGHGTFSRCPSIFRVFLEGHFTSFLRDTRR